MKFLSIRLMEDILIESDYTEIRLAEIIYSQAECLLRLGQAGEAGKLLNSVRKRNYENFTADIAYQPEGNVVLDLKEMLDEWGAGISCGEPSSYGI